MFVLAVAAGLAGCGGSQVGQNLSPTARARCEYQAASATAGTINMWQQGFERASLLQQCLRLAEMEEIEAKGGRQEGQPSTDPNTAILEKLRPAVAEPLPPATEGPRGPAGVKR
jgi:hypothetical protein